MIFYDLPIEIKNLVLSYSLGDVKLLKIKKIVILLKIILININQFISLTHQITYIILKLIISILIMDYHMFLI